MVIPTDIQFSFVMAALFSGLVMIHLGTSHQFQTDTSGMLYIWEDQRFFSTFCALLLYCAVPLAFVYFGLHRRQRA